MATSSSDAQKILVIAGAAISSMETVTKIARETLDSKPGTLESVLNVLSAIVAVGEAVAAGLRGDVSVEVVEDSLRQLKSTISDNDLAADQSLDHKFG